jgi:hypothetical protein
MALSQKYGIYKMCNTIRPNVNYLNMIQNNISRMGNTAFIIKGWSLTLTMALLSLYITVLGLSSPEEKKIQIFIINTLAIFMFWWLDAFFFYTEKKYRSIYNLALQEDENHVDTFNLNPDLVINKKFSGTDFCTKIKRVFYKLWLRIRAIFSSAVCPIYIIQIVFIWLIQQNII